MSAVLAAAAMGAFTFGADAPAAAHARMQAVEIAAEVRSYRIPAGSVGMALARIAEQNGVQMVFLAGLTRNVKTVGLTGDYTLGAALDQLLAGTGLSYRLADNQRDVFIILAENDRGTMNDASGAESLPPIDVGAERKERPRGAPAPGAASGPGDRYTGYKAENASSAMKMDTPLLKTPVSVQVVTRQLMDDQQAISVKDAIVTNVSGVQTTPNFVEAYKIRGFQNVGNFYKNGLMEYRMRYLDTANIQSIEVLKGPAAILYGRVEPGGLIDLVTKRPMETPYYSVQQQNGSYGMTRTSLDATGPLTADHSILYRFNGEFYHTYSYRDFVVDQNLFLAPTLSFHPIEQFRANIDFEYQHRTWVDDYPVLPAIGSYPAPIPISRYLQAPLLTTTSPHQYDKRRIAYDWTYDFFPGWSLTNRLSYTTFDDSQANVFGGTINQATGVLTRSLTNTTVSGGFREFDFATNVDLKGKFSTGPFEHNALIGFDYLRTAMPTYWNMTPAIGSINIYAPNYWTLDKPYSTPNFIGQAQKWTGVYGQDLISFLDDTVHVLLGGRYDWAETSSNKNTTYLGSLTTYTTVYNAAFSPRVGLVYQPAPWLSFYGNFTRSFGTNNTTTLGYPLPPQKGEQLEGGVKAELLDKRITATLAYYDLTKTNVPTPDPNNSANTLVIGKARSQGLEFDLTGRVDDNWSIIANYTHDDVRTVQGAPTYNPATLITTQVAVAGYKLPASPRNYGNLWVKYEADGQFRGLSLGGGVTVVESSLGDNANSFILPGYALLNGMVAYTTKIEDFTVTAQLNVKNITDTIYYPTSSNRTTIQTGTPRTFLGSLRVEF
ncbi:TonB-dependent receptor [Methylosinus sp. C49]|uniref:TonB-dependent siderophore receptor n=1 Tax=Methylosinus sp. C49 TaxID=2699395 RepID=UPI001379683F|nr:TonB-dependent receptor [Methylosinus sp. C49]